jgi:glycosyltransferase involved in cell wall biosynthesis
MDTARPIALYFPWVRELTGAPRSALNLFLNLNPRRWRPFLVTDQPNALSESMQRAGFEVEILPFSPLLSLRQHQGLRLGWRARARALLELRRHQRSLARVLLRRQAAVVWARNAKGALFAARSAKAAGCPYVWDVGLEDPSEGMLYLLHGWALRQADLVVTQAESQPLKIFGRRRQARYAHKFRSLMPGIDPARASSLIASARSRPPAGMVVLCVGTIHPRKNQGLLLRAALPLMAEYPELCLRFIGSALDTTYAKELERIVENSGASARVEFLGWRDDVPEQMGRAHVLVVASDNEGVPQVVREAMFAGMAVVSSAVGGIPDVIDHERTGLLYPAGDADSLRTTLRTLASDKDRLRALGLAACADALSRFSLESWCRRYDDLLWSLVHPRHSIPG